MTAVARTTVEVCDSLFRPKGLLRDWDGLELVDRLCDIGSGKVDAVASDWNRALVGFGDTVVVRVGDDVVQAGPLVFGEDPAGNSVVLKVTWRDMLSYLERRQVLPVPQVEISTDPGPLTQQDNPRSGATSSVIQGFVDANAGPSALPYRRVPGLRMGADAGVGAVLSAAVLGRFDNLQALIRPLALSGGVAYDISTTDGRVHTFNTWAIEDRSADVVFDRATHNLTDSSFSVSAPTATRLYAGDKGDGIARNFAQVKTVESLADEAVWGLVEGFFSDSGSDGESFVDAARRELSQRGASIEASFTPTGDQVRLGRDFRLGDLVTGVLRPGLSVVKPVVQVTTKVSVSAGRSVTPMAGDYGSSSGTNAQALTKELIRVVNALTRRR